MSSVWGWVLGRMPAQRQRVFCRAVCLQVINATLDELVAKSKQILDAEDDEFSEEFLSERDPSILHFLLASGDGDRGTRGFRERGGGTADQDRQPGTGRSTLQLSGVGRIRLAVSWLSCCSTRTLGDMWLSDLVMGLARLHLRP